MNIKLGKAHKLSRRMKFRGLDVSIETDKGELRHWYDPHNKTKGSTKMSHAYGYIRRTQGVDGDHVDVYVGPKEDAPNVYVVHQMKAPKFKTYDEDKCMLGFENAAAAKTAYLKNFDDPGFFGSMTTMPWAEFEKKVKATFEQPKKIAADRQENTMTPLQKAYAYGQHMAVEAFQKKAMSPTGMGLIGIGGAVGAHAAPEGETLGGAAGAMAGTYGGAKGFDALARRGLLPLSKHGRGWAALAALVGGGYAGYRGGRAVQRGLSEKEGEAALGDPNFWQGGAPPEGEAPTPAQSAEEAIQMLPAGTFQGAQIKIQPDGMRNTTVKVTPDAVGHPDGLAGIFQAEPTAKVEISQPEQQAPGGEMPAMPPPGMEGLPPEEGGMPPAEAGKMAALRVLGLA